MDRRKQMSKTHPVVHFARSIAAAASVEFAILLTPLLLPLIAGLQFACIYQAQAMLESAAEAAGRSISTGADQTASMSQADFKANICGKLQSWFKCDGLMVDVRVASMAKQDTSMPTLTYDAHGNVSNSWSYQPGASNDVVVVRVMYQWPIINVPGIALANLPNGMRLLFGVGVARNEAYQ